MAQAYTYIHNSSQCPMLVQSEIAAHNSVHATNMLGKETVWKPKAVPLKEAAPPVPTG